MAAPPSRWKKTFNRIAALKSGSDKDDAGTDGKSKWVKSIRRTSAVRSALHELDPFLERFTITTRASGASDRSDKCSIRTLFTKKYWAELVFDPSSETYYYWMFIVTLSVLYNLVVIIARAVFTEMQDGSLGIWFFFDYLADLIYMYDMFVKSRKGFLEQGILVRDNKRLGMKYVKSLSFYVDILSILPLDFLYMAIGVNALLRLNRIIKVWRLLEFFEVAETQTNFPNFFRLANLILYVLVIIHWNACIYYAISESLGLRTDDWTYPGRNNTEEVYDRLSMKYLYSFYWSTLTLTTIGDTPYPETEVAFLFCILDSLTGVLIFATIFGNIGSMINNMNAARTEFQRQVDAVKHYMETRRVGDELQSRVVKWFDYTWNNKQSIDDKQTLAILPEKLRAEIAIHVHLGTLRRVAIFQDCEPGLLVELVLKLKLQVFSPSDYVCRKGDIGKEMYIVKSGKLHVVSEDGKTIFATLSDGSVFGEVSILNIMGNKTGNRRTASVRSAGYSDLFCLSKDDLWDALTEYPEAKKLLMGRGKQILRKDNLLDEDLARREERKAEALTTKIDCILDSLDSLQSNMFMVADKLSALSTTVIRNQTSNTSINLSPSSRKLSTPGPAETGQLLKKNVVQAFEQGKGSSNQEAEKSKPANSSSDSSKQTPEKTQAVVRLKPAQTAPTQTQQQSSADKGSDSKRSSSASPKVSLEKDSKTNEKS